jgi:hypothetical protein
MDIQTFIRARLAETDDPMKDLDLRILDLHSDEGPPCGTLLEMAARWADHPDYEEVVWPRATTGNSEMT